MDKLITDITIGADPEVFIYSKEQKRIVSAIGLIGGTKEFPRPVSTDGFFVQEDNVLGEFCIPPAKTKDAFIANVQKGKEAFFEILPPSRYELAIQSSHLFSPADLHDPKALEFGCTPDFNAWLDGMQNPSPEPPEDGLRSAGGHAHVGYVTSAAEEVKKAINIHLVKWLDLFLTVPAMKMDTDTRRRELYGKAGAFRPKPYGVEYRTLSSFWIKSNELTGWAWDQIMRAVDKVNDREEVGFKTRPRILQAINQSNAKAIDSLIEEFGLVVAQ